MFITFEGPEGAGKSTLIAALAEHLRTQGRTVVVTREPGAGTVGAAIRDLVLHGKHLEPEAETFLFLADRTQHVAEIIRPALERGDIVLCDRHTDSTVAYQGYGRGQDLDRLRQWNRIATRGLSPDMTLLLDLDPAVGLARIASKDRLDSESIEFHRRIRDGFLAEAKREPVRWVVIDATSDPSLVLQSAKQALMAHLP